jgi:glutathione S-transferase
MSPKLKLVYFNTKGLAEVSRLILKISGIDFEDYRYSETKKDEYEKDKNNGLFDKSMGKLPYLEIKEKNELYVIPQSKAIERFLAKKCNLMGKSDLEEAKIDSLCECIRDIGEEYKKLQDKDDLTQLKSKLISFSNLLDPEGPYSVGSHLSLVDISIYCLVTVTFKKQMFDIVGRIPKLRDVVIKISNISVIREWTKIYPV